MEIGGSHVRKTVQRENAKNNSWFTKLVVNNLLINPLFNPVFS